jgi:hypothetical protein
MNPSEVTHGTPAPIKASLYSPSFNQLTTVLPAALVGYAGRIFESLVAQSNYLVLDNAGVSERNVGYTTQERASPYLNRMKHKRQVVIPC